MTEQHPITPPPELVRKLWNKLRNGPEVDVDAAIAWNQVIAEAAQWGADQELEECCEWVRKCCDPWPDGTPPALELRADRRPKPPSLKQQALMALAAIEGDFNTVGDRADTIRRALEALPDA